MESKKVYAAIAGVSGEMAAEGISKTRKNEQQGYRFRGIDEVMNALAPVLVKHGLLILPRMINRIATSYQSKTGGTIFNVAVEAEFDFVSVDDGSLHVVKMFGEAMDSADKATNKAMSAAYKYAAFQAFCIPTEGDNDADAHHHEVAPQRKTAPPRARAANETRGGKWVDATEAEPDYRASTPEPSTAKLTPQQRQRLGTIAKKAGRNSDDVKGWLKTVYGVTTSAQLLQGDYDAICQALEARGPLPLPGDGQE